MQTKDDRTPDQIKTHRLAVVATDRFMSGWGAAEGGVSYAAWAFDCADHEAEYYLTKWISSRSEMRRVRTVNLKNYRPTGTGHLHIYVAGADHPAFAGLRGSK